MFFPKALVESEIMANEQMRHEGTDKLLTYIEIFDFMSKYEQGLLANSDFNETIKIIHGDGSEFSLENALLEEDELRIYVYTEHCGFFWFFKDDLKKMRRTVYRYNEDKEDFDIVSDDSKYFNGE
jgi:hypothetical protein